MKSPLVSDAICKKGDVVVTIGPRRAGAGRRVLFEAKEDAPYTDACALVEIGEARKNRDTGVGVFVYSRSSAPDIKAFRRLRDDLLVVWDSEDPDTGVVVETAYAVATAAGGRGSPGRLTLRGPRRNGHVYPRH